MIYDIAKLGVYNSGKGKKTGNHKPIQDQGK
jgi:hypothetical protein